MKIVPVFYRADVCNSIFVIGSFMANDHMIITMADVNAHGGRIFRFFLNGLLAAAVVHIIDRELIFGVCE